MQSQVAETVQNYGGQEERLLEILKDLQAADNFLSKDMIIDVARELDIPVSRVYGVATFYSLYATKPRGKNIIRMCENAPCHVEGAQDVIEAFQSALGIKINQTTPDNEFSLELTSCLGICSVAPVAMINSTVYGNLTPNKVAQILADHQREA